MTSLEKLQELKIIGISDGEVAMPVFYNKSIQDSKYFYSCNVISMAATIARTIDKDQLFRGIFYDTAMKRTNEDDKPSAIYAIGKALYNDRAEYGIWQIDTANINRTDLLNVGWQLVSKAPDKFIDAAITFDGIWKLGDDFKYYSLFTEEYPWAFYVNRNNVLYRWNCWTGEKYQLDTNVNYCAAERGYYPEGYTNINSDQGVIVVYATKNHEVKYFTYSYIANGTKQWLGPETIVSFTGESIKSLQVHRLNDYRIGVLVVTNKKSYWYITDRAYSQMAFRPETFKVQSAEITPIMHAAVRMDGVAATPQPTFTWEINAAKTQVTITSNARLKLYEGYDLKSIISGTTNMPSISSVVLNDYTIVVNFTKAATATFTITLNAGNIRFVAYIPDMLEVAGGWVVVTAASHEFEIYLAQSASENFNVQAAQLKSISAEILPIYTIAQQAKEHFSVATPVISNIQAEIKDAREKVIATESENFNVQAAQIISISATIEGIGIIPI